MNAREKVIKGLKCLAQMNEPMANPCKDCGYIDRPNFAFCVKNIASDALAMLKEQETKHGEWLESKILEDCFWVCSECEFPSEAFAAPMLYKYCPNCGVKMNRR